jgi:hypothetical protein
MKETVMNDLTTVVDAWLEAYAEADVERRMKLIEQAWAPEGRLVDPPLEGKGYRAQRRLIS